MTKTLKVEGMMCMHCEARVKKALEAVPGVESAAAEQGHMYAQFNLGSSYANGDGVPQDMVEAEKWYRKAAEQGYEDAIAALKALESGE